MYSSSNYPKFRSRKKKKWITPWIIIFVYLFGAFTTFGWVYNHPSRGCEVQYNNHPCRVKPAIGLGVLWPLIPPLMAVYYTGKFFIYVTAFDIEVQR